MGLLSSPTDEDKEKEKKIGNSQVICQKLQG
jgi:hypothetical protein